MISQITAENVRVVVDLTNYNATSGTVAVPAKIYVDGFSNAGAVRRVCRECAVYRRMIR